MREKSHSITRKDTHRIPFFPGNQLLVDSRHQGWRNLYASVAAEQPWRATLPPLAHDCLVYCLHGQATIERRVDDLAEQPERQVLAPRQISLIPAGKCSEWSVTGQPEILLVYVNQQLKLRVAERLGFQSGALPHCAPLLACNDALLEQVCLSVLRQLRNRPSTENQVFSDQLAETALMHILMEYPSGQLAKSATDSQLPPTLARVISYIGVCLADTLLLSHLAHVAGCSEQHLTRQFRRWFGQTPHQYITQRRIEESKIRLVASDDRVQTVSEGLGFSSQSHFTATFQQWVGVTPTEYRRYQRRDSATVQ